MSPSQHAANRSSTSVTSRRLPTPFSPTNDSTTARYRSIPLFSASWAIVSSASRPTIGTSVRCRRRTPKRAGGDGEPRLDRALAPSGDQLPGRLVVDGVRGERERRLADDDATRWGHRLQAGRGVDHVAHRRVLGTGERADEHLAGVDADAHADVHGAVTGGVGHRAGQRLLHPQAGAHGTLGIVLVRRHGRAEQGEDAVTEQLVDPAAEIGDVIDRANDRSTRRLACSGSMYSANVVNPTRSANRTVTIRRSSFGSTLTRARTTGRTTIPRGPRQRTRDRPSTDERTAHRREGGASMAP